jgi:lipopolysaccharide/colanic/teichoic acid biosynthesis glycosyltransferase
MQQQYVAEILPEKLRLSLEYQRHRSFFSDMRVLLDTVLNLAA